MAKPVENKEVELYYEATKIPDFQGQKVLILPGAFYGSTVQLFAEAGCTKADDVEDADFVVFIGGVDVDPKLYKQEKLPETQNPSKARDDFEVAMYKRCIELDIPMFGICRGAQFLHVMNGGELWQDVQGHAGGNHIIYDVDDDLYVISNSMHHQMIQVGINNTKLGILAVWKNQISKVFKSSDVVLDLRKEKSPGVEIEVEAGYYRDTKCFFVQGHPEVGSKSFRSWCMNKLNDFLEEWECDTDTQDKLEEWRDAQRAANLA